MALRGTAGNGFAGAGHRVDQPVLLLVNPGQVESRIFKIRRLFQHAKQQPFGLSPALGDARHLGQQAQCVHVVRIFRQQFAANLFAFARPSFAQVFAGLCEQAPVGGKTESLLVNGVCFFPFAGHRQRMRQFHSN